LKPLDQAAIARAAHETGALLTAEEHQMGGLGNRVAAVLAERARHLERPVRFGMIGVPDRFGESGRPWQLVKRFGLTAEHIAARLKVLLEA
jgi:transketolase